MLANSARRGAQSLVRSVGIQRQVVKNSRPQRQMHSSTSRNATAEAATAGPSTTSPAAEADAAQPSSSRPYPFAPNAITRKRIEVMDPQIPAPRKSGRTTRGIMAAVHAQLRSQYDPDGSLTALFARKSFDTVPAGSVLIVETWNDASRTTFSTFAGALIAIRRRHTSTSFVLRNIVNRTGVEVRFNLYSPLIKDIKVVQRAVGNKKDGQLRRARRAKLYFVRHDDNRLPNVSRSIQVMRAREEREREALRRAEERSKAAATGTGQPGQQAKAGKS